MEIALTLDNEEQRERELYDLVPTLNAMGYMYERYSPYVNDYLLTYIQSLPEVKAPVLDIGVAFGVTVLDSLKHGATVIANEIHQPHLDILLENTPEEYKDRLTLNLARFPQETNFEENSLGAVLISRVINFLKGDELEEGLEKVYRWLKPGGKVYIIAETIHRSMFKTLIPQHQDRIKWNQYWPGEFENLKPYMAHRQNHLPDAIHFFTDEILVRSFEKAGFIVEKYSMFSKDNIPDDAALDGKETVGIIGVKPS